MHDVLIRDSSSQPHNDFILFSRSCCDTDCLKESLKTHKDKTFFFGESSLDPLQTRLSLQPTDSLISTKLSKSSVVHDFADKKVGGFVLQAGAVQEETLLLAHTEAILAQIMTHILDDSDSVLIHGASFLAYNSGWKKTFRFRGIIQRDLCERISIPSETFF
ncbi:Poly(ADP-ribose) glycohydrolase like protein, partial [Aduncisulcus paluster]